MSRFDPNDYSLRNQLLDILRYGDVTTTDDGWILKWHGDSSQQNGYVEVIAPANWNDKGHITYNFYYKNGKFDRMEPHSTN